MAQTIQREEGKAELHALYCSLDIDGDGKLTAEEWGQGLASDDALMRFFGDTTAEDHKALFEQLDEDGNGSLSWDEFVAGATKLHVWLKEPSNTYSNYRKATAKR